MSCPIRKTIFEHAEKLGIIDENNNTIKSIAETQEYIQALNDYAKETFGIDGDVVITQQVKNNAGIFIKLDLNELMLFHDQVILPYPVILDHAFDQKQPHESA